MTLSKNWKQYDVLYITASGIDGKEIFTWSFPLVEPKTITKKYLQNTTGNLKATISENDHPEDSATCGRHSYSYPSSAKLH